MLFRITFGHSTLKPLRVIRSLELRKTGFLGNLREQTRSEENESGLTYYCHEYVCLKHDILRMFHISFTALLRGFQRNFQSAKRTSLLLINVLHSCQLFSSIISQMCVLGGGGWRRSE